MPRLFMLQSAFVTFLLVTVTSCSPVKFSAQNSNNVTPSSKSVTCLPRLNGTAMALIINTSGTNPIVTSNCTPADAGLVWSVTKNGSSFPLPGLSGPTSTPDFAGSGVGIYRLTLQATYPGMTKYVQDSPLTVTVTDTSTPALACAPRLNDTLTEYTMTVSGTNPKVSAKCTPDSGVSYTWSVTKNGSSISLPSGLANAESTPDFGILGAGTYLISMTAKKTGWLDFTTAAPLKVVVQNDTPSSPAISCAPRLNGSQLSVTLGTTNPSLTADCTPSDVSYNWSVTRGGSAVTIAQLNGSSSTPDFLSAGPGTYLINLNATKTGHTAYNTPSPLRVIVPASPGTPHVDTHTISVSNNKLDILLVLDDSSSMLADNQRLAARLTDFVNSLSSVGFDWQMCVTLTRAQQVSTSNSNYYWGASNNWQGNPNSPRWILKAGTANTVTIFANTINKIGAGWAGTDDERAIKGAYWHAYNGEPGVSGSSGCYRDGAGLAVIILSDEDERSIGGDQTQAYYQSEKNKPLENDDLPASYVNQVKKYLGATKRLTVNSIIVRPGDSACMAAQDKEGSKSHYGVHYKELSDMTQGYVGSICASDFSTNLNYFKDSIVRSQASVTLKCAAATAITTTVTPNYTYSTTVEGTKLIFNPQIPAGSTVKVEYTCP